MRPARPTPTSDAVAFYLNPAGKVEHHFALVNIAAIQDFEDAAPYISLALLVLVLGVWAWFSIRNTTPSSKSAATGSDRSLSWLGTLAVASAALLLFQLLMGHISGSLTLLADMAHAAGDTVTYFAAYLAEKVKRDLASREVAPLVVSRLDVAAGATSAIIVAGVSINAMLDAAQRLQSRRQAYLGEDVSMIGPAILTFAIVSLVTNISLLVFRFRTQEGDGAESPIEAASHEVASASPAKTHFAPQAASPPGTTDDEVVPPPPPVPGLAYAARPRRDRQQQPAQQHMPDSPSSEHKPGTKWLHAVFHPGCDDGACSDDHQTQNIDSEKGVMIDQQGQSQQGQQQKNLNLFGATLHLATDVVRSFIVFVAGLLLQVGVISDAARTDAICALLVGGCVLLGSAAFCFAPAQRMCCS